MTVYIVGAGPGDPGLLTLRGAEVLARADVIVYERFADLASLELAPAAAERIYVGNSAENVDLTQTEINQMLVDLGAFHDTVVRLKAGDPFVFSRGPEEAAALAAAGVPFEIVPGVSSAIAAPAYAGIPITERFSDSLFTVVTGHENPDKDHQSVDWHAVVGAGGTIAILMGVERMAAIVDEILAAGMSPDTPAAAIYWGTCVQQTTLRCTVADLATAPLESPSVVVIGAVVDQDLGWFENRPLFGRRIVVTRGRGQAATLSTQLRNLGADAIEIPTIAIAEPADGGAGLRDAAARIAEYDWLVVTSPNGARRTIDAFIDARQLAGVKVAAIGPSTAQALAESGVVADLVPPEYVAESLLGALGSPPSDGGRILISSAAETRETLPDGLRSVGWHVDVVEAYRTTRPEPTERHLAILVEADTITFTSSSAVTNLVEMFGVDSVPNTIACIGPITAATAGDLGLTVAVEASVHTVDGLVDALLAAAVDS